MAWVYVLRGGQRYCIGATDNIDRCMAEHQRGSDHTTHRFGAKLEFVAAKQLPSMIEARALELQLKRKKCDSRDDVGLPLRTDFAGQKSASSFSCSGLPP
jgi:predicted GIY-YIG superfamily endonuclease